MQIHLPSISRIIGQVFFSGMEEGVWIKKGF